MDALANSFRIADIQIEGLQRVSPSPVFAALPIQAGDYADAQALASVMQSLFATGFFADIKLLHEGNVLIVRVFERPAISAINLDGNKAIKSEQLEQVMTENGLKQGEILKREVLDGLVRELERQYVSQGRYSAAVEPEIIPKPNNQVEVNINIDEGDVAGIKHINIVGNEKFSDDDLVGLFESKEAGWLSWLTSNNRYAKERLTGDIEKLESFYLDRGYLDFNVVSSQVSLSADKKAIFITLNISEGDVYTVTDIEIAGDPILPEDTIKRMVLLKKGETFAQNLMTNTSEYVTSLLGNAGYTNAEVQGIPEKNTEDKTVKVTFFVDPQKRVYVRRVLFKGNSRTSDEVLRREMRQMESASASNARIEQGKVRLERLGFFKGVTVENIPVPGTEDQVDVQYTVEEQHSDSISASLGYSQGYGATIGANLAVNNWLGTGKQVGINVNYSKYQTVYSFSYTDPYFTPDGVSRGISVYYQTRDNATIGAADYGTNAYGVNLTFGYPVTEVQRVNFGVGLSHLEIVPGRFALQEIRSSFRQLDLDQYPYVYVRNEDLPSPSDPDGDGIIDSYSLPTDFVTESMLVNHVEPGFVDLYGDKFDTASANLSWVRSTLNRGILATRGNFQSVSLEMTAPGSDLQYYKVEMKGQYFQPLTRHFTLRFKGNVGYGDGYGEMKRLPFFENFYAGGFGSVRGFERSSLGPRQASQVTYLEGFSDYNAIDIDNDGIADNVRGSGSVPVLCSTTERTGSTECSENQLALNVINNYRRSRSIGGNLLVEMSTELIFPLPFIDDQRSMQIAAFVDAGNVFDTNCGRYQADCFGYDITKLSAAYGLGMTWISPMGPLTFSISKPFQQNEFDEREAFQFSFGSGF
ncbi:outer membrane protein assembly factor BamA [Marinagarivorans algicola]|uniref:outer membrane protein assembly factor BamA n=1 Tax=Marinagarivorans algicola TaxID=1513270 RepID=UPI0006B517CF|nr:outer membrane protein assembly factor BamA [Marinagarivorans algicola]